MATLVSNILSLVVILLAISFDLWGPPDLRATAQAISMLALGSLILSFSASNAFASREDLARNAKVIGTNNLIVARIVCFIGMVTAILLLIISLMRLFHKL